LDASGRVNLGHSLEAAVLNELDRRRVETGYVKTADGLEIDFFVRNRDAHHELIQVCANLQSSETVAASYVRWPLPVRSNHVRGANYSYFTETRPGKSRRQA
jgi:predicted AAA+ superfamily ATPase